MSKKKDKAKGKSKKPTAKKPKAPKKVTPPTVKKMGKASDLADEKLDTLPTKPPKEKEPLSAQELALRMRQKDVEEKTPAQAGGVSADAETRELQPPPDEAQNGQQSDESATEPSKVTGGAQDDVISHESVRGVRGAQTGAVKRTGKYWVIVSRPAGNPRCTGCGKLIEAKYVEKKQGSRTLSMCRSCVLVHLGQRLRALDRGVLPIGKGERKEVIAAVEAMGAKVEPVKEEAEA